MKDSHDSPADIEFLVQHEDRLVNKFQLLSYPQHPTHSVQYPTKRVP